MNMHRNLAIALLLNASVLGYGGGMRTALVPRIDVPEPVWNEEKGVWVFTVESPYLGDSSDIEVLLPDDYDRRQRYRVLYLLPVERGIGGQIGDGLQELRKTDAHNRYSLIGVQPAFDSVPWYADHASNPKIRHESHLLNVVAPLIEERYTVLKEAEGRLLLGFSKSGWGALTLILRHPDVFGYAVTWDAPLMLREWVPAWGMDQHFGTEENFQKYRPADLLETQAHFFREKNRLVLLGEKYFGAGPDGRFQQEHHTIWAHEEMTRLGILHHFDNSLSFEHTWHGGWVRPAIDAMMPLVRRP